MSFAVELPSRLLAAEGLSEEESHAANEAAAVEPIRWTQRAG